MTPERIEDYRNVAHAFAGGTVGKVLTECLDEIERMQKLVELYQGGGQWTMAKQHEERQSAQ